MGGRSQFAVLRRIEVDPKDSPVRVYTCIYSAYRCLLDFGVRMYDGTDKSRFVDITISKRKCSNDLGSTGAEST